MLLLHPDLMFPTPRCHSMDEILSNRLNNENQYRIVFTGYLWRFEFFANRNEQQKAVANCVWMLEVKIEGIERIY